MLEFRRIGKEQFTPQLKGELEKLAVGVPNFERLYLSTVKNLLYGKNAALFVAFKDGKPVGFADAQVGVRRGYSGWTVVHRDLRGGTIGGKLFLAKLAWLASQGVKLVHASAATSEGFKMLKTAGFEFELTAPDGGFAGRAKGKTSPTKGKGSGVEATLFLDERKRAELIAKAQKLFGEGFFE